MEDSTYYHKRNGMFIITTIELLFRKIKNWMLKKEKNNFNCKDNTNLDKKFKY
jgi:hypothetical protein